MTVISTALLVYWGIVLLTVAVATALAIGAASRPRRAPMIVSAAFLLVALALAAVPAPPPPTPVAFAIGALSLVLAVLGGGPAATLVLAAATRGTVPNGTHGGILIAVDSGDDEPRTLPRREEVMRGGLVIGLLERLAIAASLMAGFPGAFAVVIAVKGVGRFTELAASEARERFIIGTLTSLIWASAAAGAWLLAVA